MTHERRNPPVGIRGASTEGITSTSDSSGIDAWKRRHAAARRVPPLDCGCSDGWTCRCSEPPLSDKRIDGGRDAALHLLAVGRVPLLEVEVIRALWRRGGTDRELAELLHRLTDSELA